MEGEDQAARASSVFRGCRGQKQPGKHDTDWAEHMEDIFYSVCGETLEQDAQGRRECHITGIVQDQVGCGFENPDIVVDDPGCGRDGWTRCSFKVPSNLMPCVIP